jgi:hypothetical protein
MDGDEPKPVFVKNNNTIDNATKLWADADHSRRFYLIDMLSGLDE